MVKLVGNYLALSNWITQTKFLISIILIKVFHSSRLGSPSSRNNSFSSETKIIDPLSRKEGTDEDVDEVDEVDSDDDESLMMVYEQEQIKASKMYVAPWI